MKLPPLFVLFSSIISGCAEEEKLAGAGEREADTADDTGDCEWGDCYGECMSPWQAQYSWEIPLDEFQRYTDESGVLSAEQCAQLCTEYFTQNQEWGAIIEVLACEHQGVDGEDIEQVVCDQLMEPYCEGRKHLRIDCENHPRKTIKQWFVQAAQAEIASVGAFLLLRQELKFHGAPEELLQRCLAAAKEEVVHAHLLGQICQDMGWEIPVPRIVEVEEGQHRSLFALAAENIVEGCVNEAYSALQAFHQAMVLEEPRLRDIFRQIAIDETKHAQLAMDIHEWLQTRLSHREISRLAKAKKQALAELISYHQQASQSSALEKLGLPSPRMAEKLTAEFARQIA